MDEGLGDGGEEGGSFAAGREGRGRGGGVSQEDAGEGTGKKREREREKVAGNVDPLDGHVQGRYCGDPGVCQQLSDELVGEAGSKRRLFDESKQ